MNHPVPLTQFAQELKAFRESPGYAASSNEMLKHGMKEPYIDNILSEAFSYGWSAKPVKMR